MRIYVGFIGPSSSIVVGIFAAAVSNLTVAHRDKLPWDDGLDIFAGHATSGQNSLNRKPT
jgi:ammonia channel protein AmtB